MKNIRMFLVLLIYLNSTSNAFGYFAGELSLMASYSKTDYGNSNYSTTRRYTSAVGYNLTAITQIELSYIYADIFFNQDPYQTTSINEQALALSVVQSLVPPNYVIQPYLKGGVAQFNRRTNGTLSGIKLKENLTKSPSAIAGVGVRVYLLRNFSLKAEGVCYLPDFQFSQGKNNFAVQGGVSWSF